jgi:hypothetical protein
MQRIVTVDIKHIDMFVAITKSIATVYRIIIIRGGLQC